MAINVFCIGDIYRLENPDDFNGCASVYKFSKINTGDFYYVDKSRVCILELLGTLYITRGASLLSSEVVTFRKLSDGNWIVAGFQLTENKPPVQDKKFTVTNEFKVISFGSTIVYRIKALKSFGNVQAGDLGGWVEKEENLSQKGDCWITGEAIVIENAKVMDDAMIRCHAFVRGNAVISDQAVVTDKTVVYGNARVLGCSRIMSNGIVSGDAVVAGFSTVRGCVTGNASIENSYINDKTTISGGSIIQNFKGFF